MNKNTGRILRTVAIVGLGLTAAMNFLGGAGTTCAAFGFTRAYRIAFSDLHDYKWLYQTLVVTTILTGIAGFWATVALAKGKRNAYRNTLIICIIGTILAAVQYIASMSLRGEATPANVKFFVNAFALIYFLVLKTPSIWKYIDFSEPKDDVSGEMAGGLAAIVAGCTFLSVAGWVGSSHVYEGANWVHLYSVPINVVGSILAASGLLLLVRVARRLSRRDSVVLVEAPERVASSGD